jgi:DNA-binding GntR family transcriptional regulator
VGSGRVNPVLIELLDSLWDRADRYRRLVKFVARDGQIVVEHEELVRTILGRQPEEAARVMRDHFRAARELIERSMKAGSSLSTAIPT